MQEPFAAPSISLASNPSHIRKRNGEIRQFDTGKIRAALTRAGKATGEFGELEAERLPPKH